MRSKIRRHVTLLLAAVAGGEVQLFVSRKRVSHESQNENPAHHHRRGVSPPCGWRIRFWNHSTHTSGIQAASRIAAILGSGGSQRQTERGGHGLRLYGGPRVG